MFQMLLVDDEVPSLQAIRCTLDWEALGVDAIYTATSVRAAKNILVSTPIQLLICDIEMPGEGGFVLLEWLSENKYNIVTVLLTSHTRFDYAKRAIHLGSLDYLLKPANALDMENTVKKAFEKIKQQWRQEHWNRYSLQFIELFWKDLLLHETIAPVNDEIITEAALRGIDIIEDALYLPIFIQIMDWRERLDSTEEKKIKFSVKNSMREYFIEKLSAVANDEGSVIDYGDNAYLALTPAPLSSQSLITQCARDFISLCNQYYCCNVNCYIGRNAAVCELRDITQQLRDMSAANVSKINQIAYNHDSRPLENEIGYYDFADLKELGLLIESGQLNVLHRRLDRSFAELSEKGTVSVNTLRYFKHDFLQVIYEQLRRHNISAHHLVDAAIDENEEIAITRNALLMLSWVKRISSQVISMINCKKEEVPVIDTVIGYIAQNLQNPLSCEEIAEYVHFNPDYLTRLFKKSIGLTLSQYIYTERMNLAKTLLLNTNYSVSEIALRLSYGNIAQFSRAFKIFTGKSPVAYRNDG